MPFAGLDIHKRVVEACILHDDGSVIHRERFTCDREQLLLFAERHLKRCRVAVEATSNTWRIVDLLRPLVAEIVVSNPIRTRAIAEAKIKTDKVDALVLAQLLRVDYLPRVWQPDDATQAKRRLTNRRASVVSDRTTIKNRLHAVLHQRLLPGPSNLFGTKGIAWLKALEIDPAGRAAIDSELRLLEAVDKELDAMHVELARDAYENPRVKLLMTLPGVDVAVAQTLLAALGDVTRFKSADRAASYLGIVPSTRQSADHCYHGPITKRGRSQARWMLVQAAQHLGAHPGPLGVFFRRLKKKKNHNIAVVATARKLLTIAWHMLKNNEPYRYAVPRTTETKLARLRVKVTGARRKGGNAKGAKRPAAYGTGNPTRAIPSIDQVYAGEALPPLKPPTAGEKRMVHDTGLDTVVEALHQSHRVKKKVRPRANAEPAPAVTTKPVTVTESGE